MATAEESLPPLPPPSEHPCRGSLTERARERETIKYEGSLIYRSHCIDTSKYPLESQNVTVCPDIGLMAFAQLGALKLSASRGMISLFDHNSQHVVAEATPSSALGRHSRVPARQLWLCGTSIPRSTTVPCEHVLTHLPENGDDTVGPENTASSTLGVFVVADLSQDPRFSPTANTAQWPHNRFYAGVPIRTKRGINIGVYCVFGEEVRDSLVEDDYQFMRDMAAAVMGYLESRALADKDQRTHRMVRGLGSFVEGKATLTSTSAIFDDAPLKREGILNEKQQILERRQDALIQGGMGPVPPLRPQYPRNRTLSSSTANNSSFTSSVTTTDPPPLSIQSGISMASKASSVTAPDVHAVEIKRAFSRASNIIRESIEVEGVVFLDASIASFGGLVRGFRSQGVEKSSQLRSYSSSSSAEARPSESSHASSDDRTRYCNIFGYSTSSTSSIDAETVSADQLKVPERLLKSVIRRYPAGKIFNFDLDGAFQSGDSSADEVGKSDGGIKHDNISSPSSSSDEKVSRRTTRPYNSRETEAEAIGHIFPGVRSLAVVPMWDPTTEKWFAGGIVWTKSPKRVLTTEGELSYLRAFGNTTMAEVSRIGALVSEKAKSDVLSSLSHELRSPLHGVIASVELLNGTTIDAFQGDVIHTIETSGRTLLDTLDHLLDLSKINSFLTVSKSKRRAFRGKQRGFNRGERSVESGMMSLSADTQLDLLVEEVVESVYAGFNFQRMSIAQLVSHSGPRHSDTQAMGRLDSVAAIEAFGHDMDPNGTMNFTLGGVLIYIDIDPTVSWNFRAQPGALRRVVMNLFGNSLKYTSKGYIWISLRQSASPGRNGRSKVTITVSDSGKGIGEEYLRTNLFAPFSQEDRLAPGTGLGLSLVRQIAATLGGSITVTSQSGRGTSVRVTLPLSPVGHLVERESDFSEHLEELHGLRVCLRGFDRNYERVATASENAPAMLEAVVMETLCKEWLGLQTVSFEDAQEPPDMFLYSEAALKDLDAQQAAAQLCVPTVVVCQNAIAAHNLSRSPDALKVCEFISQPAAPRKVARSLALSLHRWRQVMAGNAEVKAVASDEPALESAAASSGIAVTEAGIFRNLLVKEAKSEPSSLDTIKVAPRVTERPFFEDITFDPTSEMPHASGETVELPERPVPSTTSSAATVVSSRTPTSEGPYKYLLVDDNDINLRILASFMKRLGRQYDLAVNGLDALRLYITNPGLYTCILMDISMPVMDGLESTRQIRQHERDNHLSTSTIIALTGLASSAVQQEAFATGIDLFLTKPVRLKELQKILENRAKTP